MIHRRPTTSRSAPRTASRSTRWSARLRSLVVVLLGVGLLGGALAPAAAAQTETEEEKGRFGLNSLIHRMTGGAAAAKREPAPFLAQPAQRQDREEEADDGRQDTEEDLRMEIPAFLRRQAN